MCFTLFGERQKGTKKERTVEDGEVLWLAQLYLPLF